MNSTDRWKIALEGGSIASGTADGNTSNKLIDSGGGLSNAVVGDLVLNLTDYTFGYVNDVDSDTKLEIQQDGTAADVFPDGDEDYTVYPMEGFIGEMSGSGKLTDKKKDWLNKWDSGGAFNGSDTTRSEDLKLLGIVKEFFDKMRRNIDY